MGENAQGVAVHRPNPEEGARYRLAEPCLNCIRERAIERYLS